MTEYTKKNDPTFYTRKVVQKKYPYAKCIWVGYFGYQVINKETREELGPVRFSYDKAWFAALRSLEKE